MTEVNNNYEYYVCYVCNEFFRIMCIDQNLNKLKY